MPPRRVIELRRGGRALGGSYLYEGDGLITGWHSHEVHQIEYAIGGVVEVETASAHYLLPPQQAAWIPAGLEHQATMNPDVRTVAVMFDRAADPRRRRPRPNPGGVAVDPGDDDLRAAMADRPGRSGDAVSDAFFRTLADLVTEALDHEAPLSLPTSEHPIVAAAMAYTKEHLDTVTADEVSRAVSVSERTLRRLFQDTLGLSWRTYLLARAHAAGDGAAGRARAVGAGDGDGGRLRQPQFVHARVHSVLRTRRRRHTGKGLAAPGSDRCRPAGFSPQASNSAGQRKATADKIPAESSSSSSAEPTSSGYTTRAIERC